MSAAPRTLIPSSALASALELAERAPVFHAAGMQEVQAASNVQRDLPAA